MSDSDESPQVTVVICVLNDWRVLRLLSSLTTQSLGAHAFDVIVVASGDEDYATAVNGLPLSLRLIRTDAPRLSIKRNIGLAAVRTKYFLTIDSDCVATPDWVESMTNHLDSGDAHLVGVGGRVKKYARNTITQKYGITVDDGQATLGYLPALHLPYVAGANAGFRTDAVRDAGGYDEEFMCGEDVDICYRLGLRGGVLEIAGNAWIFHEDRRRLIDHYRRFRYLAVDQALLFKKYRQHSGQKWYIDPYPLLRVRDALAAAARGLPGTRHGDWSGFATAVATLVEAAGVLAGELKGARVHRVFYL